VSVRYHTKIPKIIAGADHTANRILRVAAFNIKSISSDYVAVRTGYLRNSAYIESSDLRAEIGYSANYASYVELGTRHMPARPFLVRAFMEEKPRLLKALAKVCEP
jgi:HK97 gp10 family phage protein